MKEEGKTGKGRSSRGTDFRWILTVEKMYTEEEISGALRCEMTGVGPGGRGERRAENRSLILFGW